MSEASDNFLIDSLFFLPPLEQDDLFIPSPAPDEEYRIRNLDQEHEEELRQLVEEFARRNNISGNYQQDH